MLWKNFFSWNQKYHNIFISFENRFFFIYFLQINYLAGTNQISHREAKQKIEKKK